MVKFFVNFFVMRGCFVKQQSRVVATKVLQLAGGIQVDQNLSRKWNSPDKKNGMYKDSGGWVQIYGENNFPQSTVELYVANGLPLAGRVSLR